MPRFVILRHDSPRGLHWDFLLEMGGVLRAWALSQPPEPNLKLPCEALPDHRLAYLEYEGPISRGRGSVTRWDRGTYETERETNEELVVDVHGERLAGRASLRQSPEQPGGWQFTLSSAPTAGQNHAG
jgi:hypothetical protein